MKRKKVTALELSKISQKWHLGEKLTEEEDALLPAVLEWEKTEYEVHPAISLSQDEEALEDLFYYFERLMKGL